MDANKVIAGNRGPIEDGIEIELSNTESPRVRRFYKGSTEQMRSALNQLASTGTRAVYRQSGPIATVEVTEQGIPGEPDYNPNDIRVETLSRTSNQVQVEILDSPYFLDLASSDIAYAQSTAKQIQNITTEGADGATEREDLRNSFYGYYASNFPTIKDVALTYLDSLLSNIAPPVVFLPVLTYRRVYASGSSAQLAASQEGSVFSTGALPIPAGLLAPIDTRNVQNTLALRKRFGFAWLKSCSFDVQSDGSLELIETYTYGSYPLHYYSGTWDSQNPFP